MNKVKKCKECKEKKIRPKKKDRRKLIVCVLCGQCEDTQVCTRNIAADNSNNFRYKWTEIESERREKLTNSKENRKKKKILIDLWIKLDYLPFNFFFLSLSMLFASSKDYSITFWWVFLFLHFFLFFSFFFSSFSIGLPLGYIFTYSFMSERAVAYAIKIEFMCTLHIQRRKEKKRISYEIIGFQLYKFRFDAFIILLCRLRVYTHF